MQRRFGELGRGEHDVVVIGGGIYGAWVAYDAALRGLDVAIVEANDWGAGTSSASSKLVHGGLRYLERFEIGLVRKALRERRRLLRLGPHRVWPLRFGVPVYRGDRIGRLKMSLGLWLYDVLAGLASDVGMHKSFGARSFAARYPFLAAGELKAGFTYGDSGTDDARLTIELIAGAVAAGATCVNHCRAVEFMRSADGEVAGVIVEDRESDARQEVRARVTINAAGAWASKLDPGARDGVRFTKGVHLVMPAMPTQDALLLTARSDGRVFFAIPWYGRTLLGTTDTDYTESPDDVRVETKDIDYLLAEARHALPGFAWTESDIHGTFAGLRVLRDQAGLSPSSVTREWSLREPAKGLLHPVGGKLTSARVEAAKIVDRVFELLGRGHGQRPTEDERLPWFVADQRTALARAEDLLGDPTSARACIARYGSTSARVLDLAEQDPALAERIVPDLPFRWAEVVHAARDEMALGLADALRRRVPLAILTRLDRATVARAADLLGDRLGWSRERREAEVASLLASDDAVARAV